jgi:hypothetical protein
VSEWLLLAGRGDQPQFHGFIVFHVSYARCCISCHIAQVMSSLLDSIQLPDSTFRQSCMLDRRSTDTILFGFATFLTVQ